MTSTLGSTTRFVVFAATVTLFAGCTSHTTVPPGSAVPSRRSGTNRPGGGASMGVTSLGAANQGGANAVGAPAAGANQAGAKAVGANQGGATAVGAGPAGGIAGRLISIVPPGLEIQPDGVASTGALDLTKAAGNDGGPGAAQELARDEFVAGYERLWRAADGRALLVSVEGFATAAGAEDGLRRQVTNGLAPRGAITPLRARVTGIPGAVALSSPPAAAMRILFTRGTFLAFVSLRGPPGSSPPAAVAADLARAEYRLLA